ncbi:MAG: peptide deformylase [Oscillospiraceae bacterium]|nr:peptide deformylase [Oscillospiraceae bacterium]
MVRPIMKDPLFLARPSLPATADDLALEQDLRDTLAVHADECVGMAANMIGSLRRVIIFDDDGVPAVMFNPEILKASEPYEAEEGCLSLSGRRRTLRYRSIRVRYQTRELKTRVKTFTGRTAQIIQHEIDHCSGILI